MGMKITVSYEGIDYSGEVMKITSTALGDDNDHGLFGASLNLSGEGTGVSFGGYCLDARPAKDADGNRRGARRPTAYGMDYIVQVMRACEVSRWEQLTGKTILTLWDSEAHWGQQVKGIANLHGTKVFNPKLHYAQWQADHPEEAEEN
jgi:hypothetical protein